MNWKRTMTPLVSSARRLSRDFSRQQPLDDNLVRAVAGHGEKSAADESGPEGIFCGEIPGKIEKLQLVSGRGCDLHLLRSAAGNAVQQDENVTALPVR